jgi:hypothetical protein
MLDLAAAVLALAAAASAAAAADVTVSGCARAGVEAGCVVISGADGTLYNISAAQPRPQPGSGGQVTGTVSSNLSACQQGVILAPATWKADPAIQCPPAAPATR